MNSLYLIGTPLGNLEDITLRALRCFRELNELFAEDTRELSQLLRLLEIPLENKRLSSFSSHNMKQATEKALFLLQSQSIGLVSDRGMPAISDPGAYLIEKARAQGVRIIPVPGPSAVTTLFSVSGVTSSSFHFLGFLPQTKKEREILWDRIKRWAEPSVFFESPKRVRSTLEELKQIFPQSSVFWGREMTKQFEEFQLKKLQELSPEEVQERGEYTICLIPQEGQVSESFLEDEITKRLLSDKEWSKLISEQSHHSASEAYNALQLMKK